MRFLLWIGILLLSAFPGCGGGSSSQDSGIDGGNQPCDLTAHLCPAGQRCNKDQACVSAEPLQIVTDNLPDGLVGFAYSQNIAATGGITPYSWAITQADAALAPLSISSSGKLTGRLDQAIQNAQLTIAVTDSGYAGGEQVQKTFTISFNACRTGDVELCFIPKNNACYQGTRTCTDGQLGPCLAGQDPSTDLKQCGPNCGDCDLAVGDTCTGGLCACGTNPTCTGALKCCSKQCLDVTGDIDNCGSCASSCSQRVAHVTGATLSCKSGSCDFTGPCDHGWADCNGKHDDGCEQSVVGLSMCGDCTTDCTSQVTHVPSGQRICKDTGTGYVCDYTGNCSSDFADCDNVRANGCETYLNDVANCGACHTDCAAAAAGHLCLTPDNTNPYQHECGCTFDTASGLPNGCDVGQICCDRVCRDGATDPQHCGVCTAVCGSGCLNASCGCTSDAECPKPSGAPSCGNGGSCVCTFLSSGATPCPTGQYCCDGTSGGSGSPGEKPDQGCCPKLCGQNSKDHPCTS